jgi:acetylornithine/N-succinyldiaminopimelate aminotransferase
VPNTAFQKAALDEKILVIGAGDNVVRLLPPLIVTDADVTEAVNKLEAVCVVLEKKN